jgi:zinc transport system permease protein
MAISTVSCVTGVLIPMQLDLPIPSGGAIIMVAAGFFVVTTVIRITAARFREA